MRILVIIALLLAPLAARASIVATSAGAALDPYSGQAYVILPIFPGDPATLSSLDFDVSLQFAERVTVQGSDGRFTLHYDARMFGQSLASATRAITVPLDAAGTGAVAMPIGLSFASPLITPNPELAISAWLTPDTGAFTSDAAHRINGSVDVVALFDPPELVPEPSTPLLLAALLPLTAALYRRREAREPKWSR